MKHLLGLLLALGMTLSLAACSSITDDSSGDDGGEVEIRKVVGVCTRAFDDSFTITCRNALQELLESKGYEVSFQDCGGDQSRQDAQISAFIDQQVDALIVDPCMDAAADTIIAAVKNANIPTVLLNCTPSAEGTSSYNRMVYVSGDAVQPGILQGELILETPSQGDINGDGKVSYIMIQGDPEDADAQLRTEHAVKTLTDADVQLEELNLTGGGWDRRQGLTGCADSLVRFGDRIEVVFCNSDDLALGALQAIQAAGRKVNEDIYLVGADGLADALDAVQAGQMTGTVTRDAAGQAEKAAECIDALLNGAVYMPDAQSIYVDYVKVTPENAGGSI